MSAEGTSRGARGASSFELMRELFADVRAQSGVVVLSAAGGAEYAMESSEWANGAFTYSILEAVQRLAADADGDHHVSVSELERYVGSRVVQLTRGGQRPTARQRNVDVDFRIR